MPRQTKDEREAETADFEAKVAALLQVDPAGLSGKHRKTGELEPEDSAPDAKRPR